MTFKIRGHRVIVEKQKIVCRCHRHREEATNLVVSRQERKTGDCYGHWGGFGLGSLIVAIQVNQKGSNALEAKD